MLALDKIECSKANDDLAGFRKSFIDDILPSIICGTIMFTQVWALLTYTEQVNYLNMQA